MVYVTLPAGFRIAFGSEEAALRFTQGRDGYVILPADHPDTKPIKAGL